MSCWFCLVREAEADHVLALELYGDVDSRKTGSETKVAYNVRQIEVPRCADCHSRHIIALYAAVGAVLMGIACLVSVLFAVYGWAAAWIWALWLGLTLGLTLGALVARSLSLKGILSVQEARKIYPEVKDLLEKGYRFGRRPKGHLPESDPSSDQADQSSGKP